MIMVMTDATPQTTATSAGSGAPPVMLFLPGMAGGSRNTTTRLAETFAGISPVVPGHTRYRQSSRSTAR